MNLSPFKNLHKGKRCWILGNGPSLNDVDLSRLKGEYTFGANRIYLSGFEPTFYTCVNPLVLQQFADEINQVQAGKFIPQQFTDLILNRSGAPVYELDTSLQEPMFSSPEGPIWEGFTVTYVALQLAYYMGFEEVILIGVDHDFGPGGLQGGPNQEVTGGDTGHFSPEYFKGARWNLPDLRMSEFAYSLAKAAFDKAGRKVVNASTHTKLRVFPLANLNNLYPPTTEHTPKVSAIVSAYKSQDVFDKCLHDLESQTLVGRNELEIVVVCQEGSYEYDNARYQEISNIVVTPDIPTVYAAWNLGIKAAHGQYITNANTDDRHHPRAYELMAQVLDARPDIDLVYHDSFITWEDDSYPEFVEKYKDAELVGGRQPGQPGYFAWLDYDKAALTRGCYIGPQPMWRRSLHQLYGYFNPDFESAGDYDFWLRISREKNFFHVPLFLGLYHASETGIELSDPERATREFMQALVCNVNQAGADITAAGQQIRVSVGDQYSFVNREDFLDLAEWIKYK